MSGGRQETPRVSYGGKLETSTLFDTDSSDGQVTGLFGTRNILAHSLKRLGTQYNGGGGRGETDHHVLSA